MLIQLIAKANSSDNHIHWALHRIEGKLYEAILRADCPDKERPAARARVSLCRWVPTASPSDADRLLRISGIIGRLTQPCVHAAVIRCWNNGWVTARRMRTLNPTRQDTCIFGCSATAHDSLDHYVCCSKLHDAGRKIVRKEKHGCIPSGIRQAVLLEGADSEMDIYFRALWLFLIYSTYNVARNSTEQGGEFSVQCLCDIFHAKLHSLQNKHCMHPWLNYGSAVAASIRPHA